MHQKPILPGDLSVEAPEPIDLVDPDHLGWVRDAAESLEASLDAPGLREAITSPDTAALPVATRLALKLALSRRLLADVSEPVHLSVVFAVYKENIRILPRVSHPHGEDFVRRKLEQLRWLFGPTSRHSWDLTIVDDGCPDGARGVAGGRRRVGRSDPPARESGRT